MEAKEKNLVKRAGLLCCVWSTALATAVFAATDDSNAVRESFDTLILLGDYGLIERYDSSFTKSSPGRIPGAGERMVVGAANLSWNNDALLVDDDLGGPDIGMPF